MSNRGGSGDFGSNNFGNHARNKEQKVGFQHPPESFAAQRPQTGRRPTSDESGFSNVQNENLGDIVNKNSFFSMQFSQEDVSRTWPQIRTGRELITANVFGSRVDNLDIGFRFATVLLPSINKLAKVGKEQTRINKKAKEEIGDVLELGSVFLQTIAQELHRTDVLLEDNGLKAVSQTLNKENIQANLERRLKSIIEGEGPEPDKTGKSTKIAHKLAKIFHPDTITPTVKKVFEQWELDVIVEDIKDILKTRNLVKANRLYLETIPRFIASVMQDYLSQGIGFKQIIEDNFELIKEMETLTQIKNDSKNLEHPIQTEYDIEKKVVELQKEDNSRATTDIVLLVNASIQNIINFISQKNLDVNEFIGFEETSLHIRDILTNLKTSLGILRLGEWINYIESINASIKTEELIEIMPEQIFKLAEKVIFSREDKEGINASIQLLNKSLANIAISSAEHLAFLEKRVEERAKVEGIAKYVPIKRSKLLNISLSDLRTITEERKLSLARSRFPEYYRTQGTLRRLDFRTEFLDYRNRLFTPTYSQQIDIEANLVQKKFLSAGINPDVWVIVPTRREKDTARAVESVLDNCKQSKLVPGVIVFHNYIREPLVETREDLQKLDNYTNVVVIDQRVHPSEPMGDIRGFPTDIAFTTAYRIGQADPIIASIDADITGYHSGQTFGTAINELINPQGITDAVVINFLPDVSLFKNNYYAFYHSLIKGAFEGIVNKYIYSKGGISTVGVGTFIKASTLCSIGSYLPLQVGEDLFITYGISALRNSNESIKSRDDLVVYFNTIKEFIFGLSRKEYYEQWIQMSEVGKHSLPEMPEADTYALLRIKEQLLNFYRSSLQQMNEVEHGYILSQLFVDLFELVNSSQKPHAIDFRDFLPYRKKPDPYAKASAEEIIAKHFEKS